MADKLKERPVVICTEFRGVFFGYCTDTDADPLELKRARLCVSWSSDVQGFMGLGATGPTKSCKIGPRADITLKKITAVLECSPEAVKAWEDAKWVG